MAISVVQNPPNAQPVSAATSCCTRLKQVAEILVQVAVRIIFVITVILTAAAALPLKFHATVLPLIGLSATFCSAFFYLFPQQLLANEAEPFPPLLTPVQVQPLGAAAAFPPQQPRGLIREGNNCSFNSVAQYLNSDPQTANWLRSPFTHEMNLAAFENFLTPYQPTDQLINDFRAYVDQQPHPRPTIPVLFRTFVERHSDFLNTVPQSANWFQNPLTMAMDLAAFENFLAPYQPTDQLINSFRAYVEAEPHPHPPIPMMFQTFLEMNPIFLETRKLRNTYEALIAIHQFLHAYDNGVPDAQNAVAAANSQRLRVAIHRLDPNISKLSNQQEDAGQILTHLFNLLPPEQLILTQNETYSNGDLTNLQQPKRDGYLTLELTENQPTSNVEVMFRNSCDYWTDEVRNIKVTFPQAPSALRFQIKRFEWVPPQPTWWSTRFPSLFSPTPGYPRKIATPIEAPEEMTITLRNGEEKRYRLASFINHDGQSANSGHYLAGRKINEDRYILNDTRIILVDQAQWQARLQQAYFLCYLPVPD